MPARTISAINAPVYTTSPNNNAANSGVHRKPPLKLSPASSGILSFKGGSGWIMNPIHKIKTGTSKYARYHHNGTGGLERFCIARKINQITTIDARASQMYTLQESKADMASYHGR